jgi:hypothetical protein
MRRRGLLFGSVFTVLFIFFCSMSSRAFSLTGIKLLEDSIEIQCLISPEEFTWPGAVFETVETFPNPWFPDGPGTRHQLSLDTDGPGSCQWFQMDFIMIGTYQILDSDRIRLSFGSIEGQDYELALDRGTGLLALDGHDYLTQPAIPPLRIETTSDLEKWQDVQSQLPATGRYTWGQSFPVILPLADEISFAFFRIRGQ